MTQMLSEICYDPMTGKGDPRKLRAAIKLTFHQIRNILYAPRDKDGRLLDVAAVDPDAQTPEETFTLTWLQRGLPRWRIAAKWREQQEAVAAREEEIRRKMAEFGPLFNPEQHLAHNGQAIAH